MTSPLDRTDQPSGYDGLLQVLADLPVICRETRRRKGLSLRAAAQQAAVSFSTLDRMERGDTGANLTSIVAILKWVKQ